MEEKILFLLEQITTAQEEMKELYQQFILVAGPEADLTIANKVLDHLRNKISNLRKELADILKIQR